MENFKKYNEINKDTVNALDMMTPEEEEMSEERERSALYNEISKYAENWAEQKREDIKESLKNIVQEHILDERMVNSVIHEFKKLKELALENGFSRSGNYGDFGKNSGREAWRGRNAFVSVGIRNAPYSESFSEEELEDIKNSVNPDHYSQFVATNLNLIDVLFSNDEQAIRDALGQIGVFEPKLEEKIQERFEVLKSWVDAWKNGGVYIQRQRVGGVVGFDGATPEDKLEFIERVVGKKCFNFSTSPNGGGEYCVGCRRIPEDFDLKL